MQLRPLYRKGKEGYPEIKFDTGQLHISGDSFPEDVLQFYNPIIHWLERYMESAFAKDSQKQTTLTCKVNYFNTGSRPFILTIVKLLNDLKRQGHQVAIDWFYYEGDDLIEEDDLNFEDLIEDFEIEVNFISMSPDQEL